MNSERKNAPKKGFWKWMSVGVALGLTALGVLYRQDSAIRQLIVAGVGLAIFCFVSANLRWRWRRLLFLERFPTIVLVITLLCLGALVGNAWMLCDPVRRDRLSAFWHGEEVSLDSGLAKQQAQWRQAMDKSAWFGPSETMPKVEETGVTYSAARLANVTQRYGRWFPTVLCILFVALATAIMRSLYGTRHDRAMRLFGVLAMLFVSAPIFLTLFQAVGLVPPMPSLSIPFVAGGGVTIIAWTMLGALAAMAKSGESVNRF